MMSILRSTVEMLPSSKRAISIQRQTEFLSARIRFNLGSWAL
jgi:hypothetical protein